MIGESADRCHRCDGPAVIYWCGCEDERPLRLDCEECGTWFWGTEMVWHGSRVMHGPETWVPAVPIDGHA